MGVTIHYTMKSKLKDPREVRGVVSKMRQLAMDLPFEEVGRIVDLSGDKCDADKTKSESRRWLLIQSGQSVQCPWNKRTSMRFAPTHVIALDTFPGPGSEPANLGLCLYPSEVEWEYKPEDDERFQTLREGDIFPRFDFKKWSKYRDRVAPGGWKSPSVFYEKRKVPTKMSGWYWRSFCKTQYASNPEAGGIANFLRCHISVVTLLERIAKLPGMTVKIDDEGHYGPSRYSDDWQEAREAGREPTYTWHKGTYSPAVLTKSVGESNEMIAAMAGALGDELAKFGMVADAPIRSFANFEQLEFRGCNNKNLKGFLEAMKTVAVPTAQA